MKKLLLTGILTICTTAAFADNEPNVDIAAGASDVSCDSGVLQTSSGSSTLEADWSPNTVHIKWYNGNNEITLSQADSAAASCEYDGTLYLPTAPTKTGYTFSGWKVRQVFNLSTWEYGNRGNTNTSVGYQNDSTGKYGASSTNTEKYGITTDNTWVREFENGTVKGVAMCSGKSGKHENTWAQSNINEWTASESELTNASGEKENCWCHATGYAPHNDAGTYSEYMPVKPTPWVYTTSISDSNEADCAVGCSLICAYLLGPACTSGYCSALFGQSN